MNCLNDHNNPENLFLPGIKDTLFFQVHRIHMTIHRLANKYLIEEQFPIRSEQFPVLITIHTYKDISQQEIADLTNRDKSSVQRTILLLQKKGLVSVHQDKKDRRKNKIRTTNEGTEIAIRLGQIVQKVENEMAEIFNAELTRDHIQSLKIIADNLEQLHKI